MTLVADRTAVESPYARVCALTVAGPAAVEQTPMSGCRYGGRMAARSLELGLDEGELASCVACGLCLPHCPTFRVTGEEGLSPRGRIDAMRGVQWRDAPVDDDFVRFMETCVQCRGCEPACPSGVPFGHLMEDTRDALARADRTAPRWLRARLRRPRPPPPAARRIDRAGAGPAAAPRPAPARPRPAAMAAWPARRQHRRRRLVVHRLRHGRMDAADPPQHGRTDHRNRSDLRRTRRGRIVLRRPPRPRRPARRRPPRSLGG